MILNKRVRVSFLFGRFDEGFESNPVQAII